MQESFTTDSEETSPLQAAWQGGNMALRKADMRFMLLICESYAEQHLEDKARLLWQRWKKNTNIYYALHQVRKNNPTEFSNLLQPKI